MRIIFILILFTSFAYAQDECQYSYSDIVFRSNGVYYDNQPLTGTLCTYYPSGALYTKTVYSGGEKDGFSQMYYDNGKLDQVTMYKNGNLDGYMQKYEYNGKLWFRILYSNDTAIDGTCGDGRVFTPEEVQGWQKKYAVNCEPAN